MRTIKFRVTEKNGSSWDYDINEAFKLAAKVQQLVGLDANGNEVYEGDVLIDELEQEYTAEIYDRPEKIHALKLKEAPDNA